MFSSVGAFFLSPDNKGKLWKTPVPTIKEHKYFRTPNKIIRIPDRPHQQADQFYSGSFVSMLDHWILRLQNVPICDTNDVIWG